MATGSALELNLTPHDLLTEQDLLDLTGVSRPDLQAQVLAANKIFFIVNANRVPKTTWFHVNNPIHLRTPTLSMSDFGYGFNKSFQMKHDVGLPENQSLKSLEEKVLRMLRKAHKAARDKVPEHIQQQIKDHEEQQAEMAKVAEKLRQERVKEYGA